MSDLGPSWPSCLFLSIFLSFPILHVNIKNIYVGVCSRTFIARILKLGIHIYNELLYYGIENWTPYSYSSLYFSIFLSFKAKFVLVFSETVQARIFKCSIICRMSDCIVGLRIRVMALIFLFFIHFSFFPYITC